MPFLRETLLFLGVAGILIPLLQRWRINQVLGFLVAGLVLGPYGIALWVERWPALAHFTFSHGPGVKVLGELGVVFLMFLIGLELSTQRLWTLRRWVFGAGLAQVLFSTLAIGVLAYAFGNGAAVSVVLGLVLSLSSTAIVMQLLTERRLLVTPFGQAVFSVLMLQDLMVVPLLIFIDLSARPEVHGAFALAALTLAKSVLAVALIYLGGKRLLAPVFRFFARQHQPDPATHRARQEPPAAADRRPAPQARRAFAPA
jgi:CPA2 family monovalent cation:H+ antiporter-2